MLNKAKDRAWFLSKAQFIAAKKVLKHMPVKVIGKRLFNGKYHVIVEFG